MCRGVSNLTINDGQLTMCMSCYKGSCSCTKPAETHPSGPSALLFKKRVLAAINKMKPNWCDGSSAESALLLLEADIMDMEPHDEETFTRLDHRFLNGSSKTP